MPIVSSVLERMGYSNLVCRDQPPHSVEYPHTSLASLKYCYNVAPLRALLPSWDVGGPGYGGGGEKFEGSVSAWVPVSATSEDSNKFSIPMRVGTWEGQGHLPIVTRDSSFLPENRTLLERSLPGTAGDLPHEDGRLRM